MRILRTCVATAAAATLILGATTTASAAATPSTTAHSASASAAHPAVLAQPAVSGSHTATAVLDLPKTAGSWSRGYILGTDAAGRAVVRPDTGTGCHNWDVDLFDVCVEVFGSGLNVTEVQGWADTFSAGWVIVYDTDETLNGLIPAAIDFVDYKFGPGGRDFPNDDSMCAHSDYAGQTACLLIHT